MVGVVRVLIIEDQAREAADAKREITEAFEGNAEIKVEVSIASDFEDGIARFRDGESDVVVLDVRREATSSLEEDDSAGCRTLVEIKKARFAPVVFWTALPGTVIGEQMPPLVTVLAKEEIEKIPSAIAAAVDSGAADTINEIQQQIADSLTEHMWNELGPNWAEYTKRTEGEGSKGSDIAQVLLSRLARIIDDKREQSGVAHPGHRYVHPPASTRRAPGDILRTEDLTWSVILTPACDLAQRKAEFVLIAEAEPLELNDLYKDWKEKLSKGKWKELERNVLRATRGRYYYLPAFRMIPDLVVDLEKIRAVSVGELSKMEHVASLVSPFSEALLIQHSQFRGRIGVPDLDVDAVRERLSHSDAAE